MQLRVGRRGGGVHLFYTSSEDPDGPLPPESKPAVYATAAPSSRSRSLTLWLLCCVLLFLLNEFRELAQGRTRSWILLLELTTTSCKL